MVDFSKLEYNFDDRELYILVERVVKGRTMESICQETDLSPPRIGQIAKKCSLILACEFLKQRGLETSLLENEIDDDYKFTGKRIDVATCVVTFKSDRIKGSKHRHTCIRTEARPPLEED